MTLKKITLYLVSCIVFSIGATFFIFSNLGTDPLDVFALGIQKHLGFKIGTTQSLFAIVCLLIYSSINKFKIPPLSTFITFFICGYLIDFFRWSLETPSESIHPYLLLSIGVLCCIQGSSGIIMSDIGVRAMDLLAISLKEKTNIHFWIYKGVFEVILFTTGYLLGGPIGIGTVIFLLGVGWLIQPFIRINEKFGITNHSKI